MARARPRGSVGTGLGSTGAAALPFVNPAPGGSEGRTDEGVDWVNIRGNVVAVAGGVITNVYRGLRGFGTTVVERLQNGEYVYYAGETGAGAPVVSAGQQVSQGQAIAPGLGRGGIEVGYWDPSTGRPTGAPGYTEGAVTSEGTRFRRNIGNGITRTPGIPQPGTPITRPGGSVGGGLSAVGNAVEVASLQQKYLGLRDMPRTAPPGTKNPAKWFMASFTGKWDDMAAGSGTASQGPSGPGTGLSVLGQVTTALLQKAGAPYGWSGQEIDDWMLLINQESKGDPNAVNPTSGAYGIGQMLAPGGSPTNLGPNIAKYRAYGGDPNTVMGQLTGMAGYVHVTYGSPSNAWAHEQQHNWY